MLAFYKVYIDGEPGLWPGVLRNSKALSNSLTDKLSSVSILVLWDQQLQRLTKVEASLWAVNRKVLCKTL